MTSEGCQVWTVQLWFSCSFNNVLRPTFIPCFGWDQQKRKWMAAAWMVRFIIILSCRTNCLVTDYIRSGDNWMLPYLKDLQTFRKNLRQFSVLITFTFLYQLFINESVSWDMVLEIKYFSCTKKKSCSWFLYCPFLDPTSTELLTPLNVFTLLSAFVLPQPLLLTCDLSSIQSDITHTLFVLAWQK